MSKNNKKIIKLQAPFELLKQYSLFPEVTLSRAIIMQMLIDATNISTEKKLVKHEKHAKKWLSGNEEDFEIICENAEVAPSEIRKLARHLIKIHRLQNLPDKASSGPLKYERLRPFIL